MSDAYTVIIAPEAVLEVTKAATWWNKNRPAAPRLFQVEMDRAITRLAERPEVGPKVRVRGRRGCTFWCCSGLAISYSIKSTSPPSK